MISDDPQGRDDRMAAALLRHDMVAPVTQILGYCELLIGDAEEQGGGFRAHSLRSIRHLGKQALGAIDQALLRQSEPDRPADLAAMVPGVLGPSHAIIEACHTLEAASSEAPDRASFLEDLARVRAAAALLIAMALQANTAPAAAPG